MGRLAKPKLRVTARRFNPFLFRVTCELCCTGDMSEDDCAHWNDQGGVS